MTKPTPKKENSENAGVRRVTLRDIAKALGISHVTVSAALRNRTGASEATKIRVRKKAEEMGYMPDPMLAALSLYRQTSKEKPVQSTLAWINPWQPPERLRQYHEFDLYWEGAADTAKRLGFRLEEFVTADLPMRRLDTILKTRHIQGLLLPPIWRKISDWKEFSWSEYATVCLSRTITYPKTHFVTSAQNANTMMAFERTRKLGYQRIGFVCEFWRKRFFGIGYSWAQRKLPPDQRLPLLAMEPNITNAQQKKLIKQWIEETKPDAIITDNKQLPDVIQELGYRVPEDIGLVTTSIHDTPIDAGIDQNPEEIGRAAVRTVVSLLNERKFGIPEIVNEILIEGKWVDGLLLPPRIPQNAAS